MKFYLINICFIFIQFYFSKCTQQECENAKPSIVFDCAKFSTGQNSCCFYNDNGTRKCKWWSERVVNTIVQNNGNTVYQCDNYRGVPCGPAISKNPQECDLHSFKTNTCCYFNDPKVQNTGRCMWWAEGYRGKNTYQGVNVTCMGYLMKISILSLLFILLNF